MGIFNKDGGISSPNPPVTSGNGQLNGVDIYHGDSVTSFSRMKSAGYEFAFIKCSERLSSDPKFLAYANAARAAGLYAGAYHFMRYDVSGAQQAQLAVRLMKQAQVRALACDWEYSDGHDPTASEIAVVKDFLSTAQGLMDRTPWIYCSDYLPQAIGNPSWFKQYPLWIARYGAQPRSSNWIIWQHSGDASIPGLGNRGDANFFRGDLNDLKRFFG